jgi:hypothetical protein
MTAACIFLPGLTRKMHQRLRFGNFIVDLKRVEVNTVDNYSVDE